MIKTIIIFIGLGFFCTPILAQSSIKILSKPFRYADGVIQPNHITQQQMDDSVKIFYQRWKQRYVKPTSQNNQLYIWSENAEGNRICVSEGQGYGMMIVALMAKFDTASQTIFDNLFYYFKAHPSQSSKYLMAWAQTDNFKDIDGTSATDGDMDIAYSLLLANTQWGSSGKINYLNEAKLMLKEIMLLEINNQTFSVLLSNAVENDSEDYFDMRSSDFMPAHFKIFSKYVDENLWNNVTNKNYLLFANLQKKYSSDAGLVPDFILNINVNPKPAKPNYLETKYDGNYNYNACRVPWRIATDFIINGDSRAKNILDKINAWIKSTTENNPDNISAGYHLSGEDLKGRNFEAMSFIASFAVAAMVDKKNQTWLNSLWDYIEGFKINQFDYYDNSIKMIALILLSGNYWMPNAK